MNNVTIEADPPHMPHICPLTNSYALNPHPWGNSHFPSNLYDWGGDGCICICARLLCVAFPLPGDVSRGSWLLPWFNWLFCTFLCLHAHSYLSRLLPLHAPPPLFGCRRRSLLERSRDVRGGVRGWLGLGLVSELTRLVGGCVAHLWRALAS